jgi:hypothetical protein
VTFSGYAAISARYGRSDRGHGAADDDSATLGLDALKLSARAATAPLAATLSLFAPGRASDDGRDGTRADARDGIRDDADVFLTDAFVSLDAGRGVTVTAGRFLSWIGQEPRDLDARWALTPGLGPMSHLAPDYHEGARLTFTPGGFTPGSSPTDGFPSGDATGGFPPSGITGGFPDGGVPGRLTLGVALLDSVYNDEHAVFGPILPERVGAGGLWRGDGSAANGLGAEVTAHYETQKLALGLTLAAERNHDTIGGSGELDYDLRLADLWARWRPDARTTLDAELLHRRLSPRPASLWTDAPDITALALLLAARREVTARFSVAGSAMIGGEKWGAVTLTRAWKIALAPSWTTARNLELRAELAWTRHGEDAIHHAKTTAFAGLQALFKFR